jgi:hypothetical protein
MSEGYFIKSDARISRDDTVRRRGSPQERFQQPAKRAAGESRTNPQRQGAEPRSTRRCESLRGRMECLAERDDHRWLRHAPAVGDGCASGGGRRSCPWSTSRQGPGTRRLAFWLVFSRVGEVIQHPTVRVLGHQLSIASPPSGDGFAVGRTVPKHEAVAVIPYVLPATVRGNQGSGHQVVRKMFHLADAMGEGTANLGRQSAFCNPVVKAAAATNQIVETATARWPIGVHWDRAETQRQFQAGEQRHAS